MLVLNRFHKVFHTHMTKYIGFKVSHTPKIIYIYIYIYIYSIKMLADIEGT
jgi:hypothetical protein